MSDIIKSESGKIQSSKPAGIEFRTQAGSVRAQARLDVKGAKAAVTFNERGDGAAIEINW